MSDESPVSTGKITSTVETHKDKALAADPSKVIAKDAAPQTGTPLGWLPDQFIITWITAHADEYKVVAEADYNNGRTVALMLHPDAVVDRTALEDDMYDFAQKIPGRYWKRLNGMRLVDCPVFTVFMTAKRTKPAKLGL